VFTSDDRSKLRDALVAQARSDESVTGAALVGSAATGLEDEWSDVDPALKLAPAAEPRSVAEGWTQSMYADHGAVHHLDLWDGGTLFRVFLLANSLQVDLSFWPAEDFRATTPSFQLLFGRASEPIMLPAPSAEHLAGMGWLHALHVRSALARGGRWQAVYMLDGMRDQVIALACVRHGLPAHQGRGVDQLSPAVTDALYKTRARDLEPDELHRAFVATSRALLEEIAQTDPELATRLGEPIEAVTQQP
jgi:predicted nucleotidyltransferase